MVDWWNNVNIFVFILSVSEHDYSTAFSCFLSSRVPNVQRADPFVSSLWGRGSPARSEVICDMMPAGHLPILLSLSALLLSPLLTGSLALCKSKLRWNLSLRVKFKSQVCQNSRIDSFFLELRVSTMQMLTLTQYWLIQWLRVAIFGSTWHIIAIPIMAKSVVKGKPFGSRSTFLPLQTQYRLIQWSRAAIFSQHRLILIARSILADLVVEGGHFGSAFTYYH